MSDTIIKVENLGKLYKLGEIGTGTLSHDLNRWWARVRGKEDPFARVGLVNDRTHKGDSEYVWALQGINFDVKQGEVLGIVGRNGAGKSTLLKILSKVTTPTTGKIKVRGRIASLLEVGTGFHPELTGRENIFLNGAVLGMSKAEVRKKFDEIVDFSGVQRYIDTPVKRYSSGMYVRLAFAVAAFLEPEILIVDEVLAVGDADFQEKCLGRMREVTHNDGRTVLFVSHNLGAVNQLCDRGLLLTNGMVEKYGDITDIINTYRFNRSVGNGNIYKGPLESNKLFWFKNIYICNEAGNKKSQFFHDEEVHVVFELGSNFDQTSLSYTIFLMLLNSQKSRIGAIESEPIRNNTLVFKLNPNSLVRGHYSLEAFIHKAQAEQLDSCEDVCCFEIIDNGSPLNIHGAYGYGDVFLTGFWK